MGELLRKKKGEAGVDDDKCERLARGIGGGKALLKLTAKQVGKLTGVASWSKEDVRGALERSGATSPTNRRSAPSP